MEKSLWRIFKPKIPHVSLNILFIPLPDTLPTHTGLRKKYMAACWPRILTGIPHWPEKSTMDLWPKTDLEQKIPFQVKRKNNNKRE